MTVARQVFPGVFMITRRCAKGQFLFSPDPDLDNAILYVILDAAKLFKIGLHAIKIMSNHYHLIISAAQRNLPRFTHRINMLIAKVVNAHRGLSESVFSASHKTNVVHLADRDAVLREMRYVTLNSVAAGLVSHPHHWPGVHTLPSQVGTVLRAHRPDFYFCSPKSTMPDEVELELSPPPMFSDLTLDEFRALYARHVADEGDVIRARMHAAGREFLGRRRIRRQSFMGFPRRQAPGDDDRIIPSVATRDREHRKAILNELLEFQAAYRVAWSDFRKGDRSVRFPPNTYGPCVLYGARCFGDPPEGAGAGSRRAAA